MCTENVNDIPIRTLVYQDESQWIACCLDFDLSTRGAEPEEAVDRLEEAIETHLKEARAGRHPLFRPVSAEMWQHYYQAAEDKLFQHGPGHGHVEHRPLLAVPIVSPA